MDPITTTIVSAVGGWLLDLGKEKVGEQLLQGIDSYLNPDDLNRAIIDAVQQANSVVPQLLSPYNPDGINGTLRFLGNFFKERGLEELKKPLIYQGVPDTEFLAKAFWIEAQSHSELQKIHHENLLPWMEIFVNTYFSKTNQFLKFYQVYQSYCKQIFNFMKDVNFVGIELQDEQTFQAGDITKIFVVPDLEEEMDDIVQEISHCSGRREKMIFGRRFPAIELLKNQNKHAVLLGEPGSGKTSLMNYFAVLLAEHSFNNDFSVGQSLNYETHSGSADFLPILIRIPELIRNSNLSIIQHIQNFTRTDLALTNDLAGFFEYWLDTGKAFLMFDGLDEVVDVTQRYQVSQKIKSFINRFENCPAIITSRLSGYKKDLFSEDNFVHFRLLSFNDEQVRNFIDLWCNYNLMNSDEKEYIRIKLLSIFDATPHAKKILSNPLLLTIVALMNNYIDEVPTRRIELYDAIITTLLETWDQEGKGLDISELFKCLEQCDWRYLIEYIAYWMYSQENIEDSAENSLICRDLLISIISEEIIRMKEIKRHQAEAEAKKFFNLIARERGGLLVHQGQAYYSFAHRSFQEYLAASSIFSQQELKDDIAITVGFIERNMNFPHWQEVLIFLVALQKSHKVNLVLEKILVLETPYEKWLHRNYIFAGLCMSECVFTKEDTIERKIIEKIFELFLFDLSSAVREKALEVLKRFHGTIFAELAFEILTLQHGNINFQFIFESNPVSSITYSFDNLTVTRNKYNDQHSIQKRILQCQEALMPQVLCEQLFTLYQNEPKKDQAAKILRTLKKSTYLFEYLKEHIKENHSLFLNHDSSILRRIALQHFMANSKASNSHELNIQKMFDEEQDPDILKAFLAYFRSLPECEHALNLRDNFYLTLENNFPKSICMAYYLYGKEISEPEIDSLLEANADKIIKLLKEKSYPKEKLFAIKLIQRKTRSETVLKKLSDYQIDKVHTEDVDWCKALMLGGNDRNPDYLMVRYLSSIYIPFSEKIEELLSSDDFKDRFNTIRLISRQGRLSEKLFEKLLYLLECDTSLIKFIVIKALTYLMKIEKGFSEKSKKYIYSIFLFSTNPFLRVASIEALLILNSNCPEIMIYSAISLFNEKDFNVLLQVINLFDIPIFFEEASKLTELIEPKLTELLVIKSHYMRCKVIELMFKLGVVSDVAVGILLDYLGDSSIEVYSYSPKFDSFSRLDSLARDVLINAKKRSDYILPALSSWIENNKNEEFIGNGIDVMLELVS